MTVIEGLNYSIYGKEVIRESNFFQKTQEAFARGQLIRELREQGCSKKYILNRGFTQEEYRKYKGKSLRQVGLEQAIGAASIMKQVVG